MYLCESGVFLPQQHLQPSPRREEDQDAVSPIFRGESIKVCISGALSGVRSTFLFLRQPDGADDGAGRFGACGTLRDS